METPMRFLNKHHQRLFNACISSFRFIRVHRDQSFKLQDLALQLHIEGFRLYVWGKAIGLVESLNQKQQILTNIVADELELILGRLSQCFHRPDLLQDLYGCKPCSNPLASEYTPRREIFLLALRFVDFQVRNKYNGIDRSSTRSSWAAHDQKKFAILVSQVKGYMDRLRQITSSFASFETQDVAIATRIQELGDTQALESILRVCQMTHPEIVNIVNPRYEQKRVHSLYRWKVDNWRCENGPALQSASGYRDDLHAVDAIDDSSIHLEMTEIPSLHRIFTPTDNIYSFKKAEPLVIPIDVESIKLATKRDSTGDEEFSSIGEVEDDAVSTRQPTGFVVEETDDQTTQYARSESSLTITEDKLEESGHNFIRNNEKQHSQTNAKSISSQQQRQHFDETLTNGFMDFEFSKGADITKRDDYFVVSFRIPRQTSSSSRLSASLGHSHYIDTKYVSRIVRTRLYVPFDLSSWPRDLQISGFIDAEMVDDAWYQALRDSRFQVNVFAIPTLTLPFCSAAGGGCLHALFEDLVDERVFAKCTPAIAKIDESSPETYVVPIGKSTYIPRFIKYNAPKFSPSSDMLLVLMVWTRQPSSAEIERSNSLEPVSTWKGTVRNNARNLLR